MRSYAAASTGGASGREPAVESPRAALRVRPANAGLLPRVQEALGGAGRPAGVSGVSAEAGALIVEFDPRRTPLALIVALIDVELAGDAGRTIEPLTVLDDATLASFVGAKLGIAGLDASRVSETHVGALLDENAR